MSNQCTRFAKRNSNLLTSLLCARKSSFLVSLLLASVLTIGCLGATGCAPDGSSPQSNGAGYEAIECPASVSELEFRNDHALEEHFEKHGDEMGCSTADEYVARANAVIAHPDALHKLQAEDGDDLYFLEDTGEFVVVSPKGFIRTYFITNRDYYDRQ